MNKREIIARRKELEEQHKSVIDRYYRVGGDVALATREESEAKSAVERGRGEHARGILAVDFDTLTDAVHAAAEKLDEVKKQANATYRARAAVEEEISDFLALHFEVFAEDAVKLSEIAEDGLQKANRAVMLAEQKWREAAATWAPLCRAAKIAPVPAFPLTRGTTIPARPPSVTSTEEADAA